MIKKTGYCWTTDTSNFVLIFFNFSNKIFNLSFNEILTSVSSFSLKQNKGIESLQVIKKQNNEGIGYHSQDWKLIHNFTIVFLKWTKGDNF